MGIAPDPNAESAGPGHGEVPQDFSQSLRQGRALRRRFRLITLRITRRGPTPGRLAAHFRISKKSVMVPDCRISTSASVTFCDIDEVHAEIT